MSRVVVVLFVVSFYLLCSSGKAGTSNRNSVAVLGIETYGVALPEGFLKTLGEQLASKLEENSWFRVIPPSALKTDCINTTCQIQSAREAGAEMLLVTRLEQTGKSCRIASTLVYLETETDRATTVTTCACDPESLLHQLDPLTRALIGERPSKDDIQRMIKTARSLMRKKALQEAAEIYTEVLRWDPKNCKVIISLAITYSEMGERQKAQAYYTKFRESCPLHLQAPGDYPIPEELKRPGDYFIDHEHIRG
jgi:tetratricopeptide (TPR) repeat protein